MIHMKRISIGLMAAGLILAVILVYSGTEAVKRDHTPSSAVLDVVKRSPLKPLTDTRRTPRASPPPSVSSREPDFEAESADAGAVDTYRPTAAEEKLAKNQIYEDTAWATLPTLSLQTHNPVWALAHTAAAGAQSGNSGPQPAPEAGPFGKIQPMEGEIWLRIPPEYTGEYRDIMAQNADLFRAETGYDGPITVTLWVGGRPYKREIYE
ncbi:MAG: hypothetical protein HKP58_14435 [Desulfatitalea sp.]|nr:hypothetical protein [Desulfatitalea sp.]NNK01603.1 hypothetical protein [Desulfatitalea sp.]